MSKSYLGLDLSLSSTGFFLLREDGTNKNFEIRSDGKNYTSLVKRVKAIADLIIDEIKDEEVTLVLMEDYFVGRFATSVIGLAALGTIVRDRLLQAGHKYILATASQIKKFESGSGSSKKGNMVKNVFRNHQFDTASDNIADACAAAYLCKGYAEWRMGKTDFLKSQTEVLKKMASEVELPYSEKETKPEKKK